MATLSSSSLKTPQISLEFPKPFNVDPIIQIPKYVFEYYNHKICNNYESNYFDILKSKAKKIQRSEISNYKIDNLAKIQKAKEFDWIYGLDKLETDYLSNIEMLNNALKIEDIITINKYFSRLAAEDKSHKNNSEEDIIPGKFRSVNIEKNIKNLNGLELKTVFIIEQIVEKHFKKKISDILDSDHKPYFVEARYLKRQLIMNKESLNQVSSMFDKTIDNSASKENNIAILREWTNNSKRLEAFKWLKERMHYYPSPSKIQSMLEKAIKSINDPKMPAIEKAAKIWFDIVRIKPFDKANQRTAKAISFAILLSNGYLPPIIFGEKDQKAYIDCFENNLQNENGHLALANFLSKQILQTQEKFKDYSINLSDPYLFEKKKS